MDRFQAVTRAEFHRYLKGVAVSAVVVLGSVVYVISDKPDTRALTAGLVSSCQRENITHAQANNTALVSFRVLSVAGRQRGSRRLLDEARGLRVTDLTDCKAAVEAAYDYKFPRAVEIGDPETGMMYSTAGEVAIKSRRLLEDIGKPAGG